MEQNNQKPSPQYNQQYTYGNPQNYQVDSLGNEFDSNYGTDHSSLGFFDPQAEPFDTGPAFDPAPSFESGPPVHVPHYVPEELNTISTGESVLDTQSVLAENGRTYHGFKEGKYFLPNDALEQDRLDLQHAMFTLALHGELHLAPMLRCPKYVMDVATGTGIWALDFADKYPKSYVVGTDLSQIQPDRNLKNCEFIKEDSEEEWLYSYKFDYIHLRAVVSCFKDPKQVFKHALQNLNPGGFIEYHDFLTNYQSIDGSSRGTAIERSGILFREALMRKGYDPDAPFKYKDWMIEAGLLDVVEIKRPIPTNGWSDISTLKKMGQMSYLNMTGGIRGLTWQLFKSLGMTDAEHDAFVQQYQKDTTNPNCKGYVTLVVTYGRKPYPGEPWA